VRIGGLERPNIGKSAHASIRAAIAREKEIKGWRRAKKVALIESLNPHWDDLSVGI
jgi:putative endonuclease